MELFAQWHRRVSLDRGYMAESNVDIVASTNESVAKQ